MRADIPKRRATQKSGAKDQPKDLEAPAQLRAESKQGHRRQESGQDRVRRRSGEDDTNRTLH